MSNATDNAPIAVGQEFDVFVFFTPGQRKHERGKGYLCKATPLWNGSTQLLPYARHRGGFAVSTDAIEWGCKIREGIGNRERTVHCYRRRP